MQTYCQTDAPVSGTRQQQRVQTRVQILDAAVRLFARAGFEASSMADIAREAGVKKALVQYHFETKENLWRSAMSHLWQQRDQALPRYLGQVPAPEGERALREVFGALLSFNRHHPEWIALVLRESATPGPRLDWLIDNFLREDIERGSAFIEMAQAAGLLPRVSPLQLLHLVSGALTYSLMVAPMTLQATGVDLASPRAMDEQVDILIKLLKPA